MSKARMKFRFAIAIIILFISNALYAQDQYIVKLNGDTLRGKLQINPMRDNTRSMYFKHEDGTKENIRPIRASYVYYDEEYQFRSIPYNNQRLFMQIVREERNLSHYNYIHKRDNSIATTKVLAKPNGDALEISALAFRKQVAKFLDDCPEVEARVEAKKYKYKDLDQLLDDYNNCDFPVVASSNLGNNQPENKSETAPAVVAANTAVASNGSPEELTAKQTKLLQVDDYRRYVRGLEDFEHARDVLEWLTDVEFRVTQGREIPNYLWNSLDAMTEGHQELKAKSTELKAALEN